MEKLPELVNKFCEEQGIKQNVPISPFESGSKMENDDLPF
jgi:peroxiredoxin